MIPIIIGGVLAAAGITTFIIGCKKIRLNTTLKIINQQIEADNETLKREHYILSQENERIYKENQFLYNQKQQGLEEQKSAAENYFNILDVTYQIKENEFDAKIAHLKALEEQKLKENKKDSIDAFIYYIDNLCKEYEKAEEDFDKKIDILKVKYSEYEQELDQLKQTYIAAKEAQIREIEMLTKLDFYSLHLSAAELNTIALIEDLKPRLPDQRVLCMLVWQTFYQKKMNTLCANVLGPNTVCGIYKITNQKSGLCYIGQSVDIAKRWKDHAKCGLGIDTPAQNKLYQAIQKDGLINFTFELLEVCDKDRLNEKEKFYINLYHSYDYGYNSNKGNN